MKVAVGTLTLGRTNLATGAFVAFHDSDDPGVQQTINELLTEGHVKQLGKVDSLCWFETSDALKQPIPAGK